MQPAIPMEFGTANQNVLDRLQERNKRIIEANLDVLAKRRIVDLACNNGRWSYAALVAGAESVVGVDGRTENVEQAKSILRKLNTGGSYRFEVNDIFDWLYINRMEPVDTILCLGVYYHIMDHYRLLTLMTQTSASTIIIDSAFVRSFRNSVHIHIEDPRVHPNALPRFEGQQAEFAGFVSLGLMIQMAWNLGFNCRPIVWDPRKVENKLSVRDYMIGRRYTLRLERTGRHVDEGWREPWKEALVTLNGKFADLLDRATHDKAVDERVRRPFESMRFSVL
jgi:SAM-dependent methyltransferase